MYGIIEKNTGRFYRFPAAYSDTSMPINQDELEYVELTDSLAAAIENPGTSPIDEELTMWQNGAWVEVYKSPPTTDIKQNRERDRDALVRQANKMLMVEDLPASLIQAIEDYKSDLEALVFTSEEIQEINWPVKPW